jgi:hypothetical protein
MRGIFSIVSLLVVLAVVGLLVKKQLGGPAAGPLASGLPATSAGAPPQVQGGQIQQQVQQAVEGAMQQPRLLPDGQ